MKTKNIISIVLTALVTVILMKNTEEVNFWIFGNHRFPKLIVLGVFFLIGLVVGYLLGRPKKKEELAPYELSDSEEDSSLLNPPPGNRLSDEDADYIH